MSDETESDGDAIDCPWCGEANGDLWEYRDADRSIEIECGECGLGFILTRHVEVTYTARKS